MSYLLLFYVEIIHNALCEPCRLVVKQQRFGETYRLHLQSRSGGAGKWRLTKTLPFGKWESCLSLTGQRFWRENYDCNVLWKVDSYSAV
jgi:hypothetical protein